MEDDFAFFVIGGFDFGVNTQPFGQNVVQTTYIGADGFFDFLFGLMGDLAAAFDPYHDDNWSSWAPSFLGIRRLEPQLSQDASLHAGHIYHFIMTDLSCFDFENSRRLWHARDSFQLVHQGQVIHLRV